MKDTLRPREQLSVPKTRVAHRGFTKSIFQYEGVSPVWETNTSLDGTTITGT
jgi:hypothetical protein